MTSRRDAPTQGPSLYDRACLATDGVADKLNAQFQRSPLLEFLMNQLGSFLYFAGQKLIDRKAKTGEERVRDEAVILSCPRLFNECFAGYALLRQGLILQAIVLLRSAFEIATQALLFMEREELAHRWLSGRRIAPKEVRRLSAFAAAERDLYARLAKLSHPNLQAAGYYAVPLPKRRAIALAYGGWFVPKSAGQIATQFMFAQLVFLEAFYTIYHDDLEAQGLLWRPETVEVLEQRAGPGQFGWPELLGCFRSQATELLTFYNSVPDDALSMSLHLDSPTPSPSWGSREHKEPLAE